MAASQIVSDELFVKVSEWFQVGQTTGSFTQSWVLLQSVPLQAVLGQVVLGAKHAPSWRQQYSPTAQFMHRGFALVLVHFGGGRGSEFTQRLNVLVLQLAPLHALPLQVPLEGSRHVPSFEQHNCPAPQLRHFASFTP